MILLLISATLLVLGCVIGVLFGSHDQELNFWDAVSHILMGGGVGVLIPAILLPAL